MIIDCMYINVNAMQYDAVPNILKTNKKKLYKIPRNSFRRKRMEHFNVLI